jgi:hypothetical protein
VPKWGDWLHRRAQLASTPVGLEYLIASLSLDAGVLDGSPDLVERCSLGHAVRLRTDSPSRLHWDE